MGINILCNDHIQPRRKPSRIEPKVVKVLGFDIDQAEESAHEVSSALRKVNKLKQLGDNALCVWSFFCCNRYQRLNLYMYMMETRMDCCERV